ncbi:MAG: DUF4363 family protein [Faecalibacterium sp.]|jgi:hypothetical protein|nr:DUF4363 family protein [Faecalibacterium sp.]
MKRIYACIAIAAVIFALAVWGGYAVHHFQTESSQQMDAAAQQITDEDFAGAQATAKAYLQRFRRQEHILSFFLRRDYLASLDVTLCAVQQYAAEENAEEALAEIARANSQIYAMCHLFFRLL